jgi:predicted regulator of Ras-like GTPase activity (Roadblock/LC7/MglB family)
LKLNFDVATKDDFVVIAAVHSNNKGDILLAFTKNLNSLGEAMAALMGMDLAQYNGCYKLINVVR